MAEKTLPDQIADLLIALVFTEKLTAGNKLPPERQLAEYLGVDRTSLRIALKILTRMNVVHTLQGSGITVLDYKVHCGFDLLADVYQIETLELGGEYLLSALDLFSHAMPVALRLSIQRSENTSKSVQGNVLSIVHKMHQSLQSTDSFRELAQLEIELIDTLLESTQNIFVQLTGSSSREIRQALVEKNYELIDVKAHLDWMVAMMMRIAGGVADMDEMMKLYAAHIEETSQPLKDYLSTLPLKPQLMSSPLRNGRNIMDLDEIMGKNK